MEVHANEFTKMSAIREQRKVTCLCASHCPRHWGRKSEPNGWSSCSCGAAVPVEAVMPQIRQVNVGHYVEGKNALSLSDNKFSSPNINSSRRVLKSRINSVDYTEINDKDLSEQFPCGCSLVPCAGRGPPVPVSPSSHLCPGNKPVGAFSQHILASGIWPCVEQLVYIILERVPACHYLYT